MGLGGLDNGRSAVSFFGREIGTDNLVFPCRNARWIGKPRRKSVVLGSFGSH